MIYYLLKDFYNEFLDQANSNRYHAYVSPVPMNRTGFVGDSLFKLGNLI